MALESQEGMRDRQSAPLGEIRRHDLSIGLASSFCLRPKEKVCHRAAYQRLLVVIMGSYPCDSCH